MEPRFDFFLKGSELLEICRDGMSQQEIRNACVQWIADRSELARERIAAMGSRVRIECEAMRGGVHFSCTPAPRTEALAERAGTA